MLKTLITQFGKNAKLIQTPVAAGAPCMIQQQRFIGVMFQNWMDRVFNKVDNSRVKEVGVDRACAEWILRCGGGVQWKGEKNMVKDYNSLPTEPGQKIYAIDMTDSAVMEEPFVYLKDLQELRQVTIWNDKCITDDSLGFLCSYTRDNLAWLKLGKCNQVTDKGLHHLRVLKKLEYLGMEYLAGVEKPEEMLAELKAALPKCYIEFPPYTFEPETPEEKMIDDFGVKNGVKKS
jgi:H+-transporting ATP synthase F0 complex subunit s